MRSSPAGIGFLAALAAAAVGSRLLQATGRGRAAAAQRAAASPEEVGSFAECSWDNMLLGHRSARRRTFVDGARWTPCYNPKRLHIVMTVLDM